MQTNSSFSPTGFRWLLGTIGILWFVVFLLLAKRGTFVAEPGTLPTYLTIAILLPIALFLLAFWLWPRYQQFVLNADVSLITSIQAWRFLGYSFFALSAYRILPAHFAFPAAIGDLIIAVTAPWVAQRLSRHPGFASSKFFLGWNLS